MSDFDDDESVPQTRGGMVSFGKFMSINTARRLSDYDNGRSYAYEAIDNRDRSKKFIAIVADIAQLPRWSQIDTYTGLADTSLLRLVGSGVLRWPPAGGKQHYIFLYQGGLGECLVKKGEFSKSQWRQPEVTNFLIVPMARMLKEMSERSFYHGSIRPSNIYYAGVDKNKPVILGDGLAVHANSTQPSVFLPINKALAEPLGRGIGSLSDDIYAFGVTLAMVLRKNDELAGLSDEDILRKKIETGSYNTIVGAERFQATFMELLRGILHDDPAVRWRLDDIFSWLDGSRVTPPSLSRRTKANRPLIFDGKKYLYPDALAADLQNNPAEVVKLVSGDIFTQWIEKSFTDKRLEHNYHRALDRTASIGSIKENSDFLVTQLTMALNPALPVHYKGLNFTFDGLGGLMARAAYEDIDMSIFKDILLQNIPDHSVTLKRLPESETLAHIKNFDIYRAALQQKKQGYGIERCIYMMCKNAPCLSPKLKGHFVYNDKSALLTFERLSKQGGQIALFLDAHSIAFFATHNGRIMERVIYDLSSADKNKKIAGNLRFLAMVQNRAKVTACPSIANVFLGGLSGVYKLYNNVNLRKKVEEGVKFEASKGNLIGMSGLIDNEKARAKDKKAFELARREYYLLQQEYDQYNIKLSNKKTYGVVNGRDAAALVAWIIATGITLMSVISFLSGYRIF